MSLPEHDTGTADLQLPDPTAYLVLNAVAAGERTPEAILATCRDDYGITRGIVQRTLERLVDSGTLELQDGVYGLPRRGGP